jgi:hypothetical protein
LTESDEEVLVGAVLYGMESFLADEVLKLRRHLRAGGQHKLSGTLLNDIFENRVLSFAHFTIEPTLNNYLNASQSFNVLTRTSFDQPFPKNKVNLFFVIERVSLACRFK